MLDNVSVTRRKILIQSFDCQFINFLKQLKYGKTELD